MAIDLPTSFSVTKKVGTEEGLEFIAPLLIDGETVELAYVHTRNKVWFTDKRIIALDVQGITGSKKEFRSFPYAKVSSFSIGTAGFLDGDSDLKIWVSGVGVFEIKFRRSLDIREVGRFLSGKTL
ncbi:MAG: PH domain-containing protein [Catalinimonas sp.]